MKHKILLMVGLLVALSVSTVQAQATQEAEQESSQATLDQVAAEQKRLFWIFLKTGKSTEGVDADEVQEMQREHLNNFKRLAGEEKLLAAGPMTDPEKKLRGIVILKANNKSELRKMFEPDPYVGKGYLKVEATEMKLEHGNVNPKSNAQGLEEFRLVVLEKNETSPDGNAGEIGSNGKGPAEVQGSDLVSALSKNKDVLLGVSLESSESNLRAILVVAKPEDDKTIDDKVQAIPAIKDGQIKSRVFPIYMGKGSLTSTATTPAG